jgi:ATP-dependent RNA helicase RhlE
MDGSDVVGLAQTGTGKTLAFAAPMAATLGRGELGLVLAPTRELAQQIEETFLSLGVHTALLVGGTPIRPQVTALKRYPDVVVATPGRLIDHLENRNIDLRCVAMLVLDEADRMLDIGFAPAIKRIVRETPDDRQTMLFSATFNKDVAKMAEQYLYEPVRIEVERAGSSNKDVEHELIVIEQEDKTRVLKKILNDFDGTVLVFSRTRHGARKLSRIVRDNGHTAAELHADRTLEQRRNALQGFKDGRFRVLVATDIAARGIDVKDIGMVLNFDVPKSAEDYVHRTGRTGRAGSKGHAVTLVTPEQGNEVRGIEKLIQFELPLSSRSSASLAKGVGKKPRSHRSRSRNRRATVA